MGTIRKPTKDEKKQICRWWNKPWRICLRQLTKEEGGDWIATIPQLGSWTFTGCGITPTEAVKSLEQCFSLVCKILIDENETEQFEVEPQDGWEVPSFQPSGKDLEELFAEAVQEEAAKREQLELKLD